VRDKRGKCFLTLIRSPRCRGWHQRGGGRDRHRRLRVSLQDRAAVARAWGKDGELVREEQGLEGTFYRVRREEEGVQWGGGASSGGGAPLMPWSPVVVPFRKRERWGGTSAHRCIKDHARGGERKGEGGRGGSGAVRHGRWKERGASGGRGKPDGWARVSVTGREGKEGWAGEIWWAARDDGPAEGKTGREEKTKKKRGEERSWAGLKGRGSWAGLRHGENEGRFEEVLGTLIFS
jgi:hypothetical protein